MLSFGVELKAELILFRSEVSYFFGTAYEFGKASLTSAMLLY